MFRHWFTLVDTWCIKLDDKFYDKIGITIILFLDSEVQVSLCVTFTASKEVENPAPEKYRPVHIFTASLVGYTHRVI